MNRLTVLALVGLWLPGCRCAPETPTPVTLRLKNSGTDPLFVDDTYGQLGLGVRRKIGDQWLSFVEAPRCGCLACDQICGGCDCTQPPPTFRRIGAGRTLERSWSGVVQTSGTGACDVLGGPTCLAPENAPPDETFELSLCYALSAAVPLRPDAGEVGAGRLPEGGVICATRAFQPADGVVEISPVRGAACGPTTPCANEGELCFAGVCTASCPEQDFPAPGGAWQVGVAAPENEGFFQVTSEPGRTVSTGSGTVTAVRYQSGTMTLQLLGEGGAGTLYVTLPPGLSAPIPPDLEVAVKVIDTRERDNRGLAIRLADGKLLLAVDSAQGAPLLAPGDMAPFRVDTLPGPIGCAHDDCGKRLFFATRFSAPAVEAVLPPGGEALRTIGADPYRFLAAGNQTYRATECEVPTLAPYAIFLEAR